MNQKYVLMSDSDTHNYLIKLEDKEEFERWLEWVDAPYNSEMAKKLLSKNSFLRWDGKDFDDCRIDGFKGCYSFENPQEIP